MVAHGLPACDFDVASPEPSCVSLLRVVLVLSPGILDGRRQPPSFASAALYA